MKTSTKRNFLILITAALLSVLLRQDLQRLVDAFLEGYYKGKRLISSCNFPYTYPISITEGSLPKETY